MVRKRKHAESEPREIVHESRQLQVYGSDLKPAKKPRRTEPVYRKQAHASSVNAIKKRIRDVSRRLERAEDIPANVRVDDERALVAYQQELTVAATEKIRQKMIKKYHMVRFFERQKATRHLKKLRKRLLECESTEEVETLKAEMHMAEVDLNYTQYCPLSEVYVSLYPQRNTTASKEGSSESPHSVPKPPMWAEVEKCTEEGTLDRLRNRVISAPVQKSKPLEAKPKKPKLQPAPPDLSGMNRRERRSQNRMNAAAKVKNKSTGFEKNETFGSFHSTQKNDTGDDQNDDSDDGFFEE